MYTPITTHDKKDFIQWFLRNFKLKKRETTWILTYLAKHDQLLEKIHFVSDAKYCPRAMILTSNCSDQIPFLFYKGQIITDNPDKLFHDIRLNPDEALYVQLNFVQANQNPTYAAVLEDNPFAPIKLQTLKQDQDVSEHLLEQLQIDYQRKALKIRIDDALDRMDETDFLKLVDELKQLEKEDVKD